MCVFGTSGLLLHFALAAVSLDKYLMDTTGEKQRAVRTGIMTPRVPHCRHSSVSYEVESSHDTTFKILNSLSFGAFAFG